MRTIDFAQGTEDWAIARSGIPTASEFDNFIMPSTFKLRDGKMVRTYLHKKLAEKWLGGPLTCFNTLDMDFGQILEEEARPRFTMDTGIEVQRVGLCLTDDGRAGCSPDGLIGDDGGLEIKCPRVETHIGYLLANELPADYRCQVYGSMWVTGRPWWKFMSYCRGLPPLILTVEMEQEISDSIGEAVEEFCAMLDEKMAALEKKNGGPPPRFTRIVKEPEPRFVSETPS